MSGKSSLIVVVLALIPVSWYPAQNIDLPANTWVLVDRNEDGSSLSLPVAACESGPRPLFK